jgi:hypothetical protein
MVKWYGATWPSHGLPHGTPLLAAGLMVYQFKNLWGPWDLNPGPPPQCNGFEKSALPTRHHSSSYYIMVLNLFKFEL